MVATTKICKSDCNICHTQTRHDILYEKSDRGTDTDEDNDNFSIDWKITWQVIQCRGCESISMKRESRDSESVDERGYEQVSTTYLPPRIFRKYPAWLKNNVFGRTCPDEVKKLMDELYISLQNDCCASATMFVRAIFEHTMIDEVGDKGTFSKNLNEFENSGFIGKKHREVVSSMLEAGHASSHRAFIPIKEDIVTLVDILEGILEVVYVQVPKAHDLEKRIPKRK